MHGDVGLARINLVAAATSNDARHYVPPTRKWLADIGSDDPATNIAAAIGFVRACFAGPVAGPLMPPMLAWTMMVPPVVRRNLGGRPLDIDGLVATIAVPMLLSRGDADTLILPGLGGPTAVPIPGASLSLSRDCAHTLFRQVPDRFNEKLAPTARCVQRSGGRTS